MAAEAILTRAGQFFTAHMGPGSRATLGTPRESSLETVSVPKGR